MPEPTTDTTHTGSSSHALEFSHLTGQGFGTAEQDPVVAAVLARLADALIAAHARDSARLRGLLATDPASALLAKLLGQLGLQPMLGILDWIASQPEGGAAVAAILSVEPQGGVLRDTIFKLHGRATAARIFAPDRITGLLAAVRETFQEGLP
jgi:hypothetical protein